MSKRVRTGKENGMEAEDALTPSVPVSPANGTSTANAAAMSVPQTTGDATVNTRAAGAAAPGKGKGGNAAATTGPAAASETKHVMLPAFLSKTFEIFSVPEFSSICGWNESGDTIIVSQLEAFVAMVLPRFFKHRNFPSFVRQLNLYGFHKTVLDSKRLEFQHPYFKRDRPDLLHLIKRKVSSNSGNSLGQQHAAARLESHREISDQLVSEMKELRNKSDAMEKRLRELEIDNAIVRSDNVKLWKHLESAKDKQLIMQEKMKKIMWILFQIYRGKQAIPKIGGHAQEDAISEDYINSSRLGPKEFRDVLRFLAMDEPPLLPNSSTAAADSSNLGSRKRKFIEVPADVDEARFGDQLFTLGPSSVVDLTNTERSNGAAMPLQMPNPSQIPGDAGKNILSLFSPQYPVPVPRYNMPGDTVSTPTDRLLEAAQPASEAIVQPPATSSEPLPPPTDVTTLATSSTSATPSNDTVATADSQQANNLNFIDDEIPLHDNYPFSEGEEQQVMKKLEDFETSLLDEYDVGCLDTLLQQLKTANMEKLPSSLPSLDSDEIAVGGPEDTPQKSMV